jgi:GAF domain-containing protein
LQSGQPPEKRDPFAILRDPERLAELASTGLLDSPADPGFDRLAALASKLLRAPVCLVSLVDGHRQFFKSAIGLQEPWATLRQTPLSHSFCRHAVATGQPLIVPDARREPDFRDNPAIPELGVVAYLGIPLVTPAGHTLGSFCVIDSVPREWTAEQIDVLDSIAAVVMTEVELRRSMQFARDALAKVRILSGLLPICAWCRQIRDEHGHWRQVEAYIRDHSEADFTHTICETCASAHSPPGAAASLRGNDPPQAPT